jgi:DNA primase
LELVDLAEVVGAYVTLRKCGSLLRGLSPFKEEKTPSFFVNPERRVFKCFSTGHGGDAIAFLMLREQMSFPEAVEFLAKKYSFQLEFEDGDSSRSAGSRSALIDIHGRMAAVYREAFFAATPQAHMARLYWTEKRKFSLDCAERYGVGLAPVDWHGTLEQFRGAYGEECLIESGLFLHPQSNRGATVPRFRGRLMFAIEDSLGRTIAFSGRALDGITHGSEAAAKYVNSPETALFHKGSALFGFARARAARGGAAVFTLTEGPLDCIRCWECGILGAVAAQGTAVSGQHMAMLRRHAVEIECLMDGDSAGRAAALRMIPHAFRAAVAIRFLRLPDGADPDTYFLAEGGGAIGVLREKSLSPVDLLVEEHLPRRTELSYAHRQQGIREILKVIGAAESKSVQLDLLDELSKKTAIPLTALREDHIRWSPMETVAAAESDRQRPTPPTRAGDYLLWEFLRVAELRPMMSARIMAEWLDGGERGERLLNYFIGEYLNGVDPAEAVDGLGEEDRNYVCGMHFIENAEGDESADCRIEKCLGRLHLKYVERQLAMLGNDGSDAATEKRVELRRELRQCQRQSVPQRLT